MEKFLCPQCDTVFKVSAIWVNKIYCSDYCRESANRNGLLHEDGKQLVDESRNRWKRLFTEFDEDD